MSKAALEAQRANEFRIRYNDPGVLISVITNPNNPEYDDRVLLPVNPNMVATLRLHGQEQAAIGYKTDDQKDGRQTVILTDGRQRWAAMQELWRQLKAEKVDPKDFPTFRITLTRYTSPTQKFETAIITNVHRTALTPLDLAKRLQNYLTLTGDSKETRERAAVLFDLPSVSVVDYTLKLLEASAPVQDALAKGEISATASRALSQAPAEQQEELLKKVGANPSTREVREAVGEATGKKVVSLPGRKVVAAKIAEKRAHLEELGAEIATYGEGAPEIERLAAMASRDEAWIDALNWILEGGVG